MDYIDLWLPNIRNDNTIIPSTDSETAENKLQQPFTVKWLIIIIKPLMDRVRFQGFWFSNSFTVFDCNQSCITSPNQLENRSHSRLSGDWLIQSPINGKIKFSVAILKLFEIHQKLSITSRWKTKALALTTNSWKTWIWLHK